MHQILARSMVAAGRAAPVIIRDLVGLAAVGAISYGAWLLHPAAGYITGGALVLTGVIAIGARAGQNL